MPVTKQRSRLDVLDYLRGFFIVVIIIDHLSRWPSAFSLFTGQAWLWIDQSMGFNPSDDGRIIRVPVPALTEDRRKLLVKQASEKVEETRIALRNIRQDALKEAKRRKEAKELSEDDVKRIEKGIDDDMSKYNLKIDEIFRAKEKDILTI